MCSIPIRGELTGVGETLRSPWISWDIIIATPERVGGFNPEYLFPALVVDIPVMFP